MIEVTLIGPKRLHRGTWVAEAEPWLGAPGNPKEPLIVAVAGIPADTAALTGLAETAATKDRGDFTTLINALLNMGL